MARRRRRKIELVKQMTRYLDPNRPPKQVCRSCNRFVTPQKKDDKLACPQCGNPVGESQ